MGLLCGVHGLRAIWHAAQRFFEGRLLGGSTYTYDANGNMTQRVIGGNTYTLSYDAENRLVSVSGPSLSATFTYDGDGNRVQSTIGSTTTTFVGNYYEVSGSTVTSYYYAGSQRVAMRTGSSVYYLLTDQLGSTSITTDTSGAKIAELRYKPWGEVRYSYQQTPTKYTYTGQYSNVSDFGLMFYNARWYDPALGRMAQADSIVPGGVQGLDRYAYANNSPLVYVDPTGHFITAPPLPCEDSTPNCQPGNGNNNGGGGGWVQDVLDGMKPGDIIALQIPGMTTTPNYLMLGQLPDGTPGYWDPIAGEYVSLGVVIHRLRNATAWGVFTRADDDFFDNYVPTVTRSGAVLPPPVLGLWWAGGVDENPEYVEVYTHVNYFLLVVDVSGTLITQAEFADNPAISIRNLFVGGGYLATWNDLARGGYIIDRVPVIHP